MTAPYGIGVVSAAWGRAERRLGADLLQPRHVRLLLIDHRPQRLDLRVQLGLGVGAVLVADVEGVSTFQLITRTTLTAAR